MGIWGRQVGDRGYGEVNVEIFLFGYGVLGFNVQEVECVLVVVFQEGCVEDEAVQERVIRENSLGYVVV